MTATLVKREQPDGHSWRLLSVVLLVAAVGFLYRSILSGWLSFVQQDQTYSYALLIPPVAIALAFLKVRGVGWKQFLADTKGAPLGYLLIAAGCLLLLLGREALLLFVMRFSFLVVLAGVLLASLGWRNLKRLAFPVCLLLFAIPLPATVYLPLSARLQLVSSTLAGHGLDLLGVPALRQGNIIVLPNASLEVAQACSGIHSLFALTATATLAAYLLVEGRRLAQTLIVLSAIPISIIFNALRIIVTGVACYTVSPDAAEGIAHWTTGMVVFALGCALIVGLCLWLARRQPAEAGAGALRPEAAPERSVGSTGPVVLSLWNVPAAILVMLFAFAIQGGIHMDRPVPLQRPLSAFPLHLGQWQGRKIAISKAELKSLNPTAVLTRLYAAKGVATPVELYVAYYSRQESGATMHSPLHCIPGAGWEVDDSSRQHIPAGKGKSILANRLIFQRTGQRMVVIYWYMQQGEPERSQLSGILATLWRSVRERRSDGCLIRLSAPISTTGQATDADIIAFARRAVPMLLHNFLPGPSNSGMLLASKR